MTDRTVPFDLQAERATLGSILIERTAIIPVAAWLSPDHFYLEKHALVYEAMLACYTRREPPDVTTVAAELRRRERLDLVGGIAFLGELALDVPTWVHVEYYAAIVKRTATLRKLIEVGAKISALGFREEAELDDIITQAEAALQGVTQGQRTEGAVPIGIVVNDLFASMERAQERRGEITGVPTGYAEIDRMTGGLQDSDLILLAARPSVGKTALALSLAYNIAYMAHQGVGIFSLEMSRDQLVQRLLAMHTGIELQRLRNGMLRAAELQRAMEGMGVLSELPIYIEDTPGQSISELRARARRMCAEYDIRVLMIDYLQLMSGRRAENRVQEVSDISRGLKALARELNIPVIALSQLSRAVEGRQSHIPMLSDLRESGSLEQDADIVMFIYREELYDRETDKKGVAEIHLAKHRNGPLGIVPLRFEARTTRFQNLDHYRAMEGY
jgi:replicative DNA helicase